MTEAENVTYSIVKRRVLDSFYYFCVENAGRGDKGPYEHVIGRTDYDLEAIYQDEPASFLLGVALFVLAAAWTPDGSRVLKAKIERFLSDRLGIVRLLATLPVEDRRDLRRDLERLGFDLSIWREIHVAPSAARH